MKYFYARLENKKQNPEKRIKTAKEYQITNIYIDEYNSCEQYKKMKSKLKPQDELYIENLYELNDKLDIISQEMIDLREKDISLKILSIPATLMKSNSQDWITTMINNLLIETINVVSELRENKIRQRQREGIDCMPKDKDGKIIGYGRKRKEISEPLQYEGETVKQACARLGMSRSAWYRAKKRTA